MKRSILFGSSIIFLICSTVLFGTVINSSRLAQADDSLSDEAIARVSGNDCLDPMPADLGYRPSLFECNGNAAILLRGTFRNIFSVVLRRVGQFNDRDPDNTSCADASCSPYKVQSKIELPDYEVDCLGGSGFSDKLQLATRIGVKFSAVVTNGLDPSQYNQWCLHDKRVSVN